MARRFRSLSDLVPDDQRRVFMGTHEGRKEDGLDRDWKRFFDLRISGWSAVLLLIHTNF
jgi:hypothetical protein